MRGNTIAHNGRRQKRAAIYLMGSGHQVRENQILDQPGPGVVVAAHPQSARNFITHNRFSGLTGLSIDLVTRNQTTVSAYAIGDGPNPARRDSGNRRLDTGNRAVHTPVWLSHEFFLFGDQVSLGGEVDPGATVEIYKVSQGNDARGPLNAPIAAVAANAQGRFDVTLTDANPGDRFSAIASHPEYGTSEPALNVRVQSVVNNIGASLLKATSIWAN